MEVFAKVVCAIYVSMVLTIVPIICIYTIWVVNRKSVDYSAFGVMVKEADSLDSLTIYMVCSL